jgi:hypothetical protein
MHAAQVKHERVLRGNRISALHSNPTTDSYGSCLAIDIRLNTFNSSRNQSAHTHFHVKHNDTIDNNRGSESKTAIPHQAEIQVGLQQYTIAVSQVANRECDIILSPGTKKGE